MSEPRNEIREGSVTVNQLREDLCYDPESGALTWKNNKGGMAKKGVDAGAAHGTHIRVMVRGRYYYAHRLAWAHYHGEWPKIHLDHINGVGSDNRIANLRLATRSENMRNRPLFRNNTSGHKGVNWHKKSKKWVARIYTDIGRKSLGYFDDPAEAAEAYKQAAITHHKEFVRC